MRNSSDCILSLDGLLGLVDGRVPLLIEVKSTWSGDHAYEQNIATALAAYKGHVAVMSFDPQSVAAFRRVAPSLPRGLIAERFEDKHYWPDLSAWQRFAMRHLLDRGHRAAALHRLRYQGAACARARDRARRLPPAAADLDGAQRGRQGQRTAFRRRHDLRRNRALAMGDIEQRQQGAEDGAVVRVVQRIAAVPASEWDACARGADSRGNAARPDNPFISHAFLHALEESGSATRATGWLPQHLVLEDAAGGIVRLHALLSEIALLWRICLRSRLGRRL